MEFKSRGIKLGALLVEKGLISQEDLDRALEFQSQKGIRLGQALTETGAVTLDDIGWALADQFDVPYVHLKVANLDPDAVRLIPEDFARRYGVIPIIRSGGELAIAIDDPTKESVLNDIKAMTGLELNISLSLFEEIEDTIDEFYGQSALAELAPPEFRFIFADGARLETAAADISGEAMIHLILEEAVRENASLIYLEPQADGMRVRFRVGGLVYLRMKTSFGWHEVLASRLRVMAGIHSGDGGKVLSTGLEVRLERDTVELLALFNPTELGETITLKVRARCKLVNLASIGFENSQLTALKSILSHQLGLMVVTGTSEKDNAATLHMLLGEIDAVDLKVVTVETERVCVSERYTQLIAEKREDLAQAVETALLMEPDVLMVDGLVDRPVFNRLLEAALAGHFVLLSQPFESAVDFMEHLISLDIPHDITATKLTVIGQRMIRTLCPSCTEAYEPDADQLKVLGLEPGVVLHRGRGCEQCSSSGYLGRRGVFEMIVSTDGIKDILRKGQGIEEVRAQLERYGFKGLRQRAVELLREGATSVEEVLLIS
ncbi:MAG: ATPase, T2SS/T4P/T4SS family [Nitrospirota bacterium]|nr:ATPase, T2SS/T4P/T4SS family [Nitrospirota bacterium]